jgi:hypothetical protein
MWRSDVLLMNAFSWGQCQDQDFIEPIENWAKQHGSSNLTFITVDKPWHSHLETHFVGKVSQAVIYDKEITGEFVEVAGFRAYLVGERFYMGLDPLDEAEQPRTLKELIQTALDMLPEEERHKAMALQLKDILTDEPHQGSFNLPKAVVLSEARRLVCPICGIPGKLRIQDGHLLCAGCNHDWGDIDNLPDLM